MIDLWSIYDRSMIDRYMIDLLPIDRSSIDWLIDWLIDLLIYLLIGSKTTNCPRINALELIEAHNNPGVLNTYLIALGLLLTRNGGLICHS